jgi:hypothetical protein
MKQDIHKELDTIIKRQVFVIPRKKWDELFTALSEIDKADISTMGFPVIEYFGEEHPCIEYKGKEFIYEGHIRHYKVAKEEFKNG